MLTEVMRGARRHIRQSSVKALHHAGLLKEARRRVGARGNTLVLMLHRVIPDEALTTCRSPRGMVLRESAFRSLLEYLSRNADLVGPGELPFHDPREGRPRVLLTFDDGWADNYHIALPLLARYKAQACFFAVTSYIGRQQPFWPERALGLIRTLHLQERFDLLDRFVACLDTGEERFVVSRGSFEEERFLNWIKAFERSRICAAIEAIRELLDPLAQTHMPDPWERLMTWEELRGLSHAGHMVASHTSTHVLLTRVPARLAMTELADSAADLACGLKPAQAETRWIAYPNGDVNETVQRQAYLNGYRFGFTTRPGVWRNSNESLAIPRVNIWDGCVISPEGVFDESRLEYALFWRPAFGDR